MMDLSNAQTRRRLAAMAGIAVVGVVVVLMVVAVVRTTRKDDHEAWEKKMKSQIDSLGVQIDSMEERAKNLPLEARSASEKAIETLREQRMALISSLHSGKGKGGAAWQEFKKSSDRAWHELSEGAKKAAKQVGL